MQDEKQPLLDKDANVEVDVPEGSGSAPISLSPKGRRQKLLDDPYESVGGIPGRILKPSTAGFTCYAFSDDGTTMATGELDGTIELWSTDDFSQLAKACKVFEKSVFPMRFVDGSNDTFVALDESGRLKEFVLTSNIGQGSSSHGSQSVRVVRDELLSERPIMWCHMAKDGRTLVYEIKELSTSFTLCSLSQSGTNRQEIFVDVASHKFPVLSDDASSLLACNVRLYDNRHDCPHVVHVWPQLDAAGIPGSVSVLTGQRAIWGCNGQYVIVLSDPEKGECLVSVYKTDHLKPGTENQPWRQRRLDSRVHYFQAQMLTSRLPSMHPRLLICEVGKSEVRRVTIWDLDEDEIVGECMASLLMQRTMEYGKPIKGPRLVDSSYVALCGTCVEADWHRGSKLANFFVAQEDIHPKCCISQDEKWISLFSWKHHSCSIVSLQSGVCVWSFSLPEDIWWDPSVLLNEVAFDPVGHHLLVLGDKCIYACAPSFLTPAHDENRLSAVSFSGTMFPGSVLTFADDLFLGADLKLCAEALLLRLCNSILTGYHNETFRLASFMLLKMTSSRLMKSLVQFDLDTLKVRGSVEDESLSKLDNLTLSHKNAQNDISRAILCLPDDEVLVLTVFHGKVLLIRDIDFALVSFNPSVDGCFSLEMKEGLRTVSILERRAVCTVKLSSSVIQRREHYRANFKTLTELASAACKWQARGRWTGEFYTGRCISEDGRTVLLGWDTKNKRSIVVKPDITQEHCEQLIEESREYLSDFCCLSRDGMVTLFTDVNELMNGKLAVGMFDERDQRVRGMYVAVNGIVVHSLGDEEKQGLLRCLFFDVNSDCSELATFVAPQHKALEGYPLKNAIKIFNATGEASYCPDYGLLKTSAMPGGGKSVVWCVPFFFDGIGPFSRGLQRFGFDVALNMPHYQGKSLFQKAFLDDDREVVDSIVALAQQRFDFQLGLELPKDSAETANLLSESLQNNSPSRVKRAIDLIGLGRIPFVQSASIMKKNIRPLLSDHPKIIEDALSEDRLIVEVCQLKVHSAYFDPTYRLDTAVHIYTADTIGEWKVDGDADIAGDRWKEMHQEEVEAMEKKYGRQREMATLKAVCLENAAGIGMNGIVRRLLMHEMPEYIFKSTLVKWVVQYKWFKIWKERFTRLILKYLTFLVFFTAYTVCVGESASVSGSMKDLVLLALNAVFGLIMFAEELLQISNYISDSWKEFGDVWWGVKYFFDSKWNWIDVASCTLLIVVIPTFHLLSLHHPEYEICLSAFIAIEAILSSIKVWYFAQPFRNTGALVLLINNVVKQCMAFLLLAFVVLFGFALALHVSSRHAIPDKDPDWDVHHPDATMEDDVSTAFGTFLGSMLTLFYVMTGALETEAYNSGDLHWLRTAVVVVYMSAQMIMLLNLLIAIMGDTFDKVKNTEEEQMLMARSQFIDASETELTKRQKKEMEKKIGKYIFALVPINEESEMDERREWLGRMKTMERSVRKQVKESEQRLLKDIDERIEGMHNQIEAVNDRIEGMHNQVNGIEGAMLAIQDQLAHILSAVEPQEQSYETLLVR